MCKVILDIDSVGDDILAVIYGALHPGIELCGITTVCGACGSMEQANRVALNTVALTGKRIPVYAGAEQMLAPRESGGADPVNFDETLRWKFGDRLDSFNTPAEKPELELEPLSAVDYIIKTVTENPGEITLVTTGPLTNLATTLLREPGVGRMIRRAYVLGGTFHVAGNITPASEYNVWADPEAAKIVLRSDIDIVLVPLDVCENNEFADGMLTRDHLADLHFGGGGRVVDFITEKYPIYIDLWREFFQLGGFPMDDVITLALAADEGLCKYSDRVFVDVELEGSITRGATVAYFGHQIVPNELKERRHTRIAQKIDGKRFMNLFVETILRSCAEYDALRQE